MLRSSDKQGHPNPVSQLGHMWLSSWMMLDRTPEKLQQRRHKTHKRSKLL